MAVRGLTPRLLVRNPEAANGSLTLNTLGGKDTIRLGNRLRGLIRTTVNA